MHYDYVAVYVYVQNNQLYEHFLFSIKSRFLYLLYTDFN